MCGDIFYIAQQGSDVDPVTAPGTLQRVTRVRIDVEQPFFTQLETGTGQAVGLTGEPVDEDEMVVTVEVDAYPDNKQTAENQWYNQTAFNAIVSACPSRRRWIGDERRE